MRDVGLDEIFEFATICTLEGTKAPNIKRLSKMRGVYRKAKGNDVVLLAVGLELGRMVAVVAIENNHPIHPSLPGLRMFVEVLDPFQSRLVICPAIWRRLDDPGRWKVAFRRP